MKLVLAERDWPIRAVLTYEAVCPTRAKMGIVRKGASLWLAYAALAMLNSTIGQALYKEMLEQEEGRSRTPSGLSINVLRELPVAAVTAREEHLKRVAYLAHQVCALYEAQEAHIGYFGTEISATRERLLTEICRVLGFSEERARELIATAADLGLADYPKPDPQLDLFSSGDELPPIPPVGLLKPEERRALARMERVHRSGEISEDEKVEWTRLLDLRLWEERLRTLPPEFLEGATAPASGDEPFPIERLHGVRLLRWDERLRDHLGETHLSFGIRYIDMLHRLLREWASGDVSRAAAHADQQGLDQNDLLWRVVQAFAEMSPLQSRERGLLEAVISWGRGRFSAPVASPTESRP